jgi:hypothetical protein
MTREKGLWPLTPLVRHFDGCKLIGESARMFLRWLQDNILDLVILSRNI